MIVVYTCVVGDIIHKGHITFLRNAKILGDILIVGVLTDSAVELIKPLPVMSFSDRVDIVQSLEMVDMVVPQEHNRPGENIISIRPDIVVESTSHDDDIIASTDFAANAVGARVVNLPYWPLESSSGIKKKIRGD